MERDTAGMHVGPKPVATTIGSQPYLEVQTAHPAFSDGGIALDACAYLHYAQYDSRSPLYHADFVTLLATNPSFSGDDLDAFVTFLDDRVAGPDDALVAWSRSRRPPSARSNASSITSRG